jgi:hypothetical protein
MTRTNFQHKSLLMGSSSATSEYLTFVVARIKNFNDEYIGFLSMSFILNDSGGKYVVNHRSSAKSYYSSSRVSVYEIIYGINEDEAFMLHNN